jgi:hypothetical protein
MEWDCGNCKNFKHCKREYGMKKWELCADWEQKHDNKDT